jgi:hydroxyacylglutathione hydrolase
MLYLKQFTFNAFQQNTYVLYDENNKAFFIDAGNSTSSENEALSAFIAEKELVPEKLLLTHAHLDHIMGGKYIHEKWGLLPQVHKAEMYFFEKMQYTADMYGMRCEQAPYPVTFLDDGQEITLGNYKLKCILAPGHSPGSICFYIKEQKLLLGGDVLFNGSIGRTDLPLGNHEQLITAIKERLLVLPEDTRVYCGHGQPTTIGREKATNPFLTPVEPGY